MAIKQNFSTDEWTKVSESVVLASMAITASEPSGLWGTLMETFAGGLALDQALEQFAKAEALAPKVGIRFRCVCHDSAPCKESDAPRAQARG
jgi:hypothetical protein